REALARLLDEVGADRLVDVGVCEPRPAARGDELPGDGDDDLLVGRLDRVLEDLIPASIALDELDVPADGKLEDGVDPPRDEPLEEAAPLRLGCPDGRHGR